MRTVAILVHAGAGLLAFLLGVELVAEVRAHERPSRFRGYFLLLVTMVATLLLALEIDWPDLGAGARIGFTALLVLAVVMLWHADRAGSLLPDLDDGSRLTFIDHVGFTLVALFDGFIVVFVLESSAPPWLAVVAGVAGIALGHRAIQSAKHAAEVGPEA